jgi:hypothetical protein
LQLGGDTLIATTGMTSEDILVGGDLGLTGVTAAGAQAGTLLNSVAAGNPGIYFKVYNPANNKWYAVPGWEIP